LADQQVDSWTKPEGMGSVPGRSAGADRDCTDFDSQVEAQRLFIANGGPASNPHKLDSGNNGIACESN
jgi:hypothetical protein